MCSDANGNETNFGVCLPSWVFHDVVTILEAVARLPERWLEPCVFSFTGDCTDHVMPSCPQQRALSVLGELYLLGLRETQPQGKEQEAEEATWSISH